LKERIFDPNSKEEFVEWASDQDEPTTVLVIAAFPDPNIR